MVDLDFQPENLPPRPEKDSAPAGPARPAGGPVPEAMAAPQPVNQPPAPPKSEPISPPPPPAPETHPRGVPQAQPHRRSLLPILIILFVVVAAIALVVIVILPRLQQPITTTTQTTPTAFEQEPLTIPSTTLPSTTTPAGRDSTRKQDLKKIETNLAAYFAENQSYPIVPEVEKLNSEPSILVKALVPKYVAAPPKDPLDPDFWYGYKSIDGKTYELSARLEDTTDTEAVLVGSKYLYLLRK